MSATESSQHNSQISSKQSIPKGKNRKNLLLMLLAFALPVILAKVALEFQWLDLGVTNKGTLLSEELTLKKLGINDVELEGQWMILYNLPEQCQEFCEKAMETVHNTYVALGKEMPRITPVALYQQQLSNTQMHHISKSQWRLLAMPSKVKQTIAQSQIFIVDPLGNVFLSHKLPADSAQLPQFGKQIMADMKKLLKYSKVG